MEKGIKLYIEGDFALFTRPEMKGERVSYDVITPSAARGVLEAIYWKPQIRWVVKKIHVLKPIRFFNFRRNELGCRMTSKKGVAIEDNRQQRASLLLRDVAYVIEAEFEVLGRRFERNGPELPESDCAAKHLEMFKRRARSGQCFQQPYFGCREFPVRFRLIEGNDAFPQSELPESEKNKDFGWMFLDNAFVDVKKAKGEKEAFLVPDHRNSGSNDGKEKKTKYVKALPQFFRAEMKNGVIDVPAVAQTPSC